MAENKKKSGLHLTIGAITLVLGAVALVLFLLSFTTNYYTFGQMKSPLVLTLILGGLVFTALSIWLHHKFPRNILVRFVPFAVIACFAAAAMLLVGDRVEGIGNCIMTDYDSGHGGEEAIYMSLASSVLMLIAVVYNIIGCFHKDPTAPGKKRNLIYSIVAAVLVVAVAVATIMLTGVLALGNRSVVSDGQGGYIGQLKGTYTVSFNQNNGNLDDLRDFQFLCSDFSGIANYDSRLFVDMKLTLDGAGSYTLFSEVYCVEAGKRCEVGDDTGLGQVITMNAEGSYTTTDTGTVITSVPTHAVFEMEMDTYSVQMKEAVGMKVGEHDEDGVYDSNEYPEVLDFVPETAWTLADGAIVSYLDPNAEAESEEEEKPAEAPAAEGVTIVSDDEGTTITFFPDGTYRFDFESYGIVDEGTYTYADGVLTLTDVNGLTYTADGDPMHLHYGYSGAPDQLTGEYTIPASTFDFNKLPSLTVLSDDRGTTMTFVGDGTYRFWFEAYQIEDLGTWQIADGVLTLTDANGKEIQAEGAPYKLHYVYSMSDQLTGDYTIPVGAFPMKASGTSVPSDDFGTGMTFFEDGTYLFTFDSYGILDEGTWTFKDGVLTLTDANGRETKAEGESLKLHYAYSMSDQLTGDFTIDPAIFAEKMEK